MKKLLSLFCIVALIVGISSLSHAAAAGSCASDAKIVKGVRILIFPWTSSSGGAVTEVGSLTGITGVIFGVYFDPDGTDQPTALYDVTIINDDGFDVLMGLGADLAQAASDSGNKRTPLTVDGQLVTLYNETLTPAISNAGDAKKGIVYIIMSE